MWVAITILPVYFSPLFFSSQTPFFIISVAFHIPVYFALFFVVLVPKLWSWIWPWFPMSIFFLVRLFRRWWTAWTAVTTTTTFGLPLFPFIPASFLAYLFGVIHFDVHFPFYNLFLPHFLELYSPLDTFHCLIFIQKCCRCWCVFVIRMTDLIDWAFRACPIIAEIIIIYLFL